MSFLFRRLLPLVAVSNLIASVALAHPGHDGHEGGGEFAWDFTHLGAHPVATLACVVVFGVAAWMLVARFSAVRRERTATVRR
jgi:hydrogenase/urease accessory protein HupE